jgi:hypothetical protein
MAGKEKRDSRLCGDDTVFFVEKNPSKRTATPANAAVAFVWEIKWIGYE